MSVFAAALHGIVTDITHAVGNTCCTGFRRARPKRWPKMAGPNPSIVNRRIGNRLPPLKSCGGFHGQASPM